MNATCTARATCPTCWPVRLGGPAAELAVFGEGPTGAANNLAGATRITTRTVREFGLSPELGPIGCASSHPHFLGETADETPHSERITIT
ncbi:hypothetical protein ABT187_12185 [Streptomyces sp. NPDC001817]|uniref:hypothetical protein n=1 Tax=Streptomyces sp. NPDC001817 TaxID=3154398 RepID=UPI00331A6861